MDIKKYIDLRIIGLIGASLMILSEFLPWFSELSLFEIYLISTLIQLEDSFLHIFPLMCGIICLLAGLLFIYYKKKEKVYTINSVIINFIGLGFFLIFLLDFIPSNFDFLPIAGLGFYLCIAGFLLIIIDVVNLLSNPNSNEQNKEGN